MNSIKILGELPKSEQQGILTIIGIPLKITVKEGSFLHIGGSPSPLTEKKGPVFSVDGKPAIPASSFKGAFRHQLEQVLVNKKNELKTKLGIADEDLMKPCIPAPRPSKAEQELLKLGYREHCEVKVEEDKVIVENGLCPVCYFFGATGLMGFLRVPNFWPDAGEHRIDQTSIRIDRKSGTAATGALITSEQVKSGTCFRGTLEIIAKQEGFEFGRARTIGGTKVDQWLDGLSSKSIKDAQLLLINELLIPAMSNITVLGGQKSKGAGKVTVEFDETQLTKT
jgi:CRISPR/Cas system CSM-associated protein Csm3 (group 7 of RAMP superfamily)